MAVAERSADVIDLRDPPRRVVALDAVRGLAMVVMLLAVNPGPRDGLVQQLRHPEWDGVRFADHFFPLFLFAVGGAMVFSDTASTPRRVLRRAGILFGLGVVLQTIRHGAVVPQGVLQHIAIAYVVAWAILRAPRRWHLPICGALLLACWLAFLAFAGGGDPWREGGGFAETVNGWFFGGFRTEGVPQSVVSAVHVVAGAAALRGGRVDVRRTATRAVALVSAGLALAPVVPLNKHLWTPSFALLTIGTSLAMFVGLHLLADRRGWRLTPLVELGCNAIAVYALFIGVGGSLSRVRGPVDDLLAPLGDAVVANGWAIAWLLLGWAFAHALYRLRLFIKI